MSENQFTIEVFNSAYEKQGQVTHYNSCWVDFVGVLDVGEGEIILDERSNADLTALIYTLPLQPILVTVTVNGNRWPGRIVSATVERKAESRSGVITCNLVSESVWLRYLLASQNGADAGVIGMPAFDTQTGPVASVAAYFINAAAARTGSPVRALPPLSDDSPVVTLQGRYPATVFDVIGAALAANGMAMDVDLWLPGDPSITGLADAGMPFVTFSPRQLGSRPNVRWSEESGKLTDVVFQLSAATGYRAVVGLAGDGAAKVYDTVIDPTPTGSVGSYALPEIAVEASNATLGTPSQQAGIQELINHRGSLDASFTVQDNSPYEFGVDFLPGDFVNVFIGNTAYVTPITKIRASNSVANGFSITPSLGDVDLRSSGVEIMSRALASVSRQVRLLQAR